MDEDGIVAGHKRRLAALAIYEKGGTIRLPGGRELPAGQVPVLDVSGWSEAQRRAYIIADNQTTLESEWDTDVLKLELSWLEGSGEIDIGASTGNVGRALADTLEARKVRLIALDNAADMLDRYSGPGEPVVADARAFDYAAERPDLIAAFLVLMFVPVADRAALLARLKDAVRPGGAVIVFDKMAARGGHVGSVIYRMTLAAKYEAGALPEEIIAKELSLAGVQRPMEEAELAGFEPIFRFGDFAGWLYERPAI